MQGFGRVRRTGARDAPTRDLRTFGGPDYGRARRKAEA
jgi:hypothetical protein